MQPWISALSELGTFVRIVRHGSLAAAARQLEVPKSTVSRRLARLEEQLAVPLVHRGSKGLVLTVEGNRLYDAVASSIDEVEAAMRFTQEGGALPRGHIRITAPSDFGRVLLLRELHTFARRWPEITFELQLTNRYIDLVKEGFDLAVRAFSGGEVPGSAELISRKFLSTRLQLTMGRGETPVSSLSEIRDRPFVLFRGKSHEQILELQDESGHRHRVAVRGQFVVNDFSSMVELVAAGAGLGLMPKLHADYHAERLQVLLPQYSVDDAQISLVYPSRKLPLRVSLLMEHLSQSFAEA